jgi:3-methyladenine DNA glycosylase AlkC
MKTANKLAQIAKANQQGKFKVVKNHLDLFYGTYAQCVEYTEKVGGTFTIEKVKEKCPYEAFQKKVAWGSHQYVRYVIKRCKELASKGYGSVEITIDKTTDMFNKIESKHRGYSHDFVVKLLSQEGFELHDYVNHYDAISYILYWQLKPTFSQYVVCSKDDDEQLYQLEQEWERVKLPQAPDSEKIGMSWE